MRQVVAVDGVSLNGPAWGATIRGLVPALRGEDTIIPGRSGTIMVPNRPSEAGEFVLSIWILGVDPTTGAMANNLRDIQRQLEINLDNILGRLFRRGAPLDVQVTRADGSVRRAYAIANERSEVSYQGPKTRAEITVVLEIPTGYWEDLTATTQWDTAGAGNSRTFVATNLAGTTGIIEDAVITVQGPITNPKVLDHATASWVALTGIVGDSLQWEINAGAYTSQGPGGSNLMGATTHGGAVSLLLMAPAAGLNIPILILTGTSTGGNTRFAVTAKRKYLLP